MEEQINNPQDELGHTGNSNTLSFIGDTKLRMSTSFGLPIFQDNRQSFDSSSDWNEGSSLESGHDFFMILEIPPIAWG